MARVCPRFFYGWHTCKSLEKPLIVHSLIFPCRMPDPELSIIIVSFNTRELLCDCLRSLRRVEAEVLCERIVVDNSSSDGSADAVREQFPEVRLIEMESNRGFAAAMNAGLRQARAPLIMALNPDTLVPPGSLPKLTCFLRQHPQVVVVGAELTNPDGTTQPSTFRFPSLFREFWNFLPELKEALKPRRLYYGSQGYVIGHAETAAYSVASVSGAAFVARTEVLRQAGGFDEEFFLYHEEMDLFHRIQSRGGEVWTLPGAQVIHFDSRSSGYRPGRFPSGPLLRWRILGMDRLWWKHKSKQQHYLWRVQARMLLTLRIVLIRITLFFAASKRREKQTRIGELQGIVRALQQPPDHFEPYK